MRKTKIICTLGPSTDKGDVLETLIKEGMDVARFNFSHGPHEEQRGRIQKLRKLRAKYNRPVAALLDTKGPEIRLKTFENESVVLEKGQEFRLGVGDFAGTQKKVAITYEKLYEDVKKGDSILIDDGLIGMVVERVEGTDIVCKVINGGKVSNKKGINVPGVV